MTVVTMLRRPRVFIGSSKERLHIAHAIHRHLTHGNGSLMNGVEATTWDTAFDVGDTLLEALTRAAEQFDFAIFVVGQDDVLNFRGELHRVPRDNVIFELGIFVGRLGPRRTFVVLEPGTKLPGDLGGLITANMEERSDRNVAAAIVPACVQIMSSITKQFTLARGEHESERTTYIYRNIEDLRFVEKVSALISKSSEITFVGTGLNLLEHGNIKRTIVERVASGEMTATICFGNPYAPHVRSRLVEEERGAGKPPVAASGIRQRVTSMLQVSEKLPNIQVKLFNNYPTMAIFRFDNRDFVCYPMGYRKLGNQCPALYVSKPGIYADFLDEMIKNYLDDAVDAREVFRVREGLERDKCFVGPPDIRAVGIYAIPDERSEFYRNGCDLLGYDVFGRYPMGGAGDAVHFRHFVGYTAQYGFHVTVADVMYLQASQIPALICELRDIAASVRRFDFAVKEVPDGTFGKNSIVLECSDSSGQFERLAAEVCIKLRCCALGTNYTLDPNVRETRGPLSARDEVMLEAYQSPFVLCRMHPHFSLASPSRAPEPADRERMQRTIRERFHLQLEQREKVHIDRLYVLTKPVDADRWDPVKRDHTIWLS